MDKYGEPFNRCSLHPSRAVVGICSSCLRDRLVSLARVNHERRRREIVYTSDPSSSGYLSFKTKNHDDVEGIRDLDLVTRTKPRNYNSSDEKKERKLNFFGLRSFLGFIRKRDCRNNVSVRERLENGLQGRQDRFGDVQDSWVPSVRTKTGCPSSARRSISERRSTVRPYSKGPALRRSTSDNNERQILGSHEEIMDDTIESDNRKKLPNHCEYDEGKLIQATDSLARCRCQRFKGRTRDLEIKGSEVGSVINDCFPSNKTTKPMNYDLYYIDGRPHERRQGGRSELGQQS